jgi:hypothetical protein
VKIKTYTRKTTIKTMDLIRNGMGLDVAPRFGCLLAEADQTKISFLGVIQTFRFAKGLNDIIITTLAQLMMPQKIEKIVKHPSYNLELEPPSRNGTTRSQARVS